MSTSRGSYFMTELLSAISVAASDAGCEAELVFDAFPSLEEDAAYVVVPHEFHAHGDPAGFPDAEQRARTIALCTENPGTPWFEETYGLVAEFAAAVSINRSSAAELRRRGIPCEHIQLGYSPTWDSWHGDECVERAIDVLYLGGADPRRDPLLAGIGGELWARECQFLVPPLERRTRPRPDFLTGEEKYRRLRSTRTLLNLHRTSSAAFEWMRFLEAICNGCVVVSEPCLDNEPLIAGEHFLVADADGIAAVLDGLLDDPARLKTLRERAYEFIRRELPMGPAVERMCELAHGLPRHLPTTRRSAFSNGAPAAPPPPTGAEASPRSAEPPLSAKASSPSAKTSLLRRLRQGVPRRAATQARHPGLDVLATTGVPAIGTPRVSVLCVFAPERERQAVAALASVAASRYHQLELLALIADASRDGAGSVLARFLGEHPALAADLLRRELDDGVAAARNALAERARGEFLFTLDADGGIYPSTLERLVRVLDAHPQAAFAYPMVGGWEGQRPVELLSSLPWEPERLRAGNWIDGMALIRRSRLLELGGYSADLRLAGLEDFYLWCRFAQAGADGVHVPQVLAWRARTAGAETPEQSALMRELFPGLLAT
ncbi:MAG TPA: glycosyltransferase [Solirubrobacteraceae bacterium]|nr:glycosyltransferase [Solirubrobacteraceae bacterium]